MGEIIKNLRLSKGMTQEQLGAYIGVQKSAIRKYESGRVENIPRSSIEKMAMLFGVKPSYLLGFDGEDEPSVDAQPENGIIICRDGKKETRPMTKEELAAFDAFYNTYMKKNQD
jgi:repressor LexA